MFCVSLFSSRRQKLPAFVTPRQPFYLNTTLDDLMLSHSQNVITKLATVLQTNLQDLKMSVSTVRSYLANATVTQALSAFPVAQKGGWMIFNAVLFISNTTPRSFVSGHPPEHSITSSSHLMMAVSGLVWGVTRYWLLAEFANGRPDFLPLSHASCICACTHSSTQGG